MNPVAILAGTPENLQREILYKSQLIEAAQQEIEQARQKVGEKYDAYVLGLRDAQIGGLTPEQKEQFLNQAQQNKEHFLDGWKHNGSTLIVSMVEGMK